MRENKIETHFVKRCAELGGDAEKFSSPNRKNVPDRLVTFPKKVIAFAEFKATGEVPTPAQERDHKRRRKKGFKVYVIDNIGYANVVAAELYRKSR